MCALLVGEGDEAVAATETGHGVHHETQVPDRAALLEQRDEFVLEHLSRDLAAEHLQAPWCRNIDETFLMAFSSYLVSGSGLFGVVAGRGSAILALTHSHVERITGSIENFLQLT